METHVKKTNLKLQWCLGVGTIRIPNKAGCYCCVDRAPELSFIIFSFLMGLGARLSPPGIGSAGLVRNDEAGQVIVAVSHGLTYISSVRAQEYTHLPTDAALL